MTERDIKIPATIVQGSILSSNGEGLRRPIYEVFTELKGASKFFYLSHSYYVNWNDIPSGVRFYLEYYHNRVAVDVGSYGTNWAYFQNHAKNQSVILRENESTNVDGLVFLNNCSVNISRKIITISSKNLDKLLEQQQS